MELPNAELGMCGLIKSIVCLCLLWQMCAAALARDLGVWRELTAEEERARTAGTPFESTDPSTIEADFNSDGVKDQAMIAIRRTDQVRGLIAVVKGQVHVLVVEPKTITEYDGLGVAQPGEWNPICGNALRAFHQCGPDNPRKLRLKNPGILLIGDGTTVLYYWNEKSKRFQGVMMVD